jgi:hypothetical protein
MTDQDIREEQKEALFQAAEAKRKVDAIKSRAARFGRILKEVGDGLVSDPAQLATDEFRHRVAVELGVANTGNYSDAVFDHLGFLSLAGLARECKAAEEKLAQWEGEKKRLRID